MKTLGDAAASRQSVNVRYRGMEEKMHTSSTQK